MRWDVEPFCVIGVKSYLNLFLSLFLLCPFVCSVSITSLFKNESNRSFKISGVYIQSRNRFWTAAGSDWGELIPFLLFFGRHTCKCTYSHSHTFKYGMKCPSKCDGSCCPWNLLFLLFPLLRRSTVNRWRGLALAVDIDDVRFHG